MFGLEQIVEMNEKATANGSRLATGLPEEGTPRGIETDELGETEFAELVEQLERPPYPVAPPKIEWLGPTWQITIPGVTEGPGAKEFIRGNQIMEWEAHVYSIAGGFTLLTSNSFGYWNDPVGHQTYVDHNRIYNVCCSYREFRDIMDKAIEIFKDEKAIFAVKLGDCVTFTRT